MRSGDRPDQLDADTRAFLLALGELDAALDANISRAQLMQRRIGEIQSALGSGRALREIVPREDTPLLVALLSQSVDSLAAYGSRVRRIEAQVLHGEGLTMDEIARLFGVTRQRISALLRDL